jgi:probable HAF family extracellular repeat protein
MCYTQNRFKALLSACVLSLIATASWSQSLTWLGVLPNGYDSYAYDVSADGSVVVGEAQNAARQFRALRWTASLGMQDLGTLGGNWSWA